MYIPDNSKKQVISYTQIFSITDFIKEYEKNHHIKEPEINKEVDKENKKINAGK